MSTVTTGGPNLKAVGIRGSPCRFWGSAAFNLYLVVKSKVNPILAGRTLAQGSKVTSGQYRRRA